ncbi:MAG: zf-HC2 domain-containing protein [Cyclobacteriaceae bacterium]|nr:zf-HC2 domain-containing protein [Cyclobacteriaceae bacterium]
MNCQQCEELLMRFDALTPSEKEQLAMHTITCAACAQALEFIRLQQKWISKIEQPEPAHAAALTQKIMQALPEPKTGFEFGFINFARVAFATGSLALFFWLGSELLMEKPFHKPASVAGPVLNSSHYITNPQQREAKTISLTERLKAKGYEME